MKLIKATYFLPDYLRRPQSRNIKSAKHSVSINPSVWESEDGSLYLFTPKFLIFTRAFPCQCIREELQIMSHRPVASVCIAWELVRNPESLVSSATESELAFPRFPGDLYAHCRLRKTASGDLPEKRSPQAVPSTPAQLLFQLSLLLLSFSY